MFRYVTRYLIRTADTYRVIRRGFKTREGAEGWAIDHFCVEWELEGGWVIEEYMEEV